MAEQEAPEQEEEEVCLESAHSSGWARRRGRGSAAAAGGGFRPPPAGSARAAPSPPPQLLPPPAALPSLAEPRRRSPAFGAGGGGRGGRQSAGEGGVTCAQPGDGDGSARGGTFVRPPALSPKLSAPRGAGGVKVGWGGSQLLPQLCRRMGCSPPSRCCRRPNGAPKAGAQTPARLLHLNLRCGGIAHRSRQPWAPPHLPAGQPVPSPERRGGQPEPHPEIQGNTPKIPGEERGV